jgi:hypothetical protein
MLHSLSRKTSAAKCLLPLLLMLGAAATQAASVAPTGYNVSYVLCRADSQAIQYAQIKGGWMSLSSSGSSQKLLEQSRDDWSVYLMTSTGKSVWLDLFTGICHISSSTKSFTVDTSAAL